MFILVHIYKIMMLTTLISAASAERNFFSNQIKFSFADFAIIQVIGVAVLSI